MTAQLLPQSSIPAAFDREHLYSPTAELVAQGVEFRAGDAFDPMPAAPRGNPSAWAQWWNTIAHVEVPDFLGLVEGDGITIQCASGVVPGTVVTPYRFGALVRYPLPVGEGAPDDEVPCGEMYVRCRNRFGHWYR